VAQRVVWEHETGSGNRSYNGGILSTDGNLMFPGRGNGELWVYAADTGKVLKVLQTKAASWQRASAYVVNGEQYVAVPRRLRWRSRSTVGARSPSLQCPRASTRT
jgi:outer membrane protein assembly factor BamB